MDLRELFGLKGRVAAVTGGSIGLGRQMAECLAELGADVGQVLVVDGGQSAW